MRWFSGAKPDAGGAERAARAAEWEAALGAGHLPAHVADRLGATRDGRAAWVASMTPAELLLARSHGVRPLATVSGTCWFHYGWSWTEGHAEGWRRALDRVREEARAAGANAVIDARLRTTRHAAGASMDFTLIGTAVRIDRLPPSPDPVIATVPALEFVRLLEADIVPVGVAVGARYQWLGGGYGERGMLGGGDWTALSDVQAKMNGFRTVPIMTLTNFWEAIRRDAHRDLREQAARQGNGVLAHTHFGQLLRRERDKQPAAYLGRHIVVGTVVDAKRNAPVSAGIEPVVDMRDSLSPLARTTAPRHAVYDDFGDEEGGI